MSANNEMVFKEWVKEYSDNLYSYIIKRGFDSETAKDLVQETFLAAWRNMDNYKAEASVKNWLFVIVKSKMTDHYRKSANKVMINAIQLEANEVDFFDEHDHWKRGLYPEKWTVNFSSTVEVKEFNEVIKSCSKKLKEIQQVVFVMKYIEEQDSEEICKALNITSSNYWVIMHRAKVVLRACLQKNWLDK